MKTDAHKSFCILRNPSESRGVCVCVRVHLNNYVSHKQNVKVKPQS